MNTEHIPFDSKDDDHLTFIKQYLNKLIDIHNVLIFVLTLYSIDSTYFQHGTPISYYML